VSRNTADRGKLPFNFLGDPGPRRRIFVVFFRVERGPVPHKNYRHSFGHCESPVFPSLRIGLYPISMFHILLKHGQIVKQNPGGEILQITVCNKQAWMLVLMISAELLHADVLCDYIRQAHLMDVIKRSFQQFKIALVQRKLLIYSDTAAERRLINPFCEAIERHSGYYVWK